MRAILFLSALAITQAKPVRDQLSGVDSSLLSNPYYHVDPMHQGGSMVDPMHQGGHHMEHGFPHIPDINNIFGSHGSHATSAPTTENPERQELYGTENTDSSSGSSLHHFPDMSGHHHFPDLGSHSHHYPDLHIPDIDSLLG